MTTLSPTPRSTLTRKKNRAATDRQALYDVLDAALICHLGLVLHGSPVVLPTGYGRDGDTVYFHGSTGSGNLRAAAEGIDVCLTVTLLDGIVYARSLNNHSMNYRCAVVHGNRCAVVHGNAKRVDSPEEKTHGLKVVTEHLAPGSWDYARGVTAKELASVVVLSLDLAEASVKIRAGEPGEEPEDEHADHIWAGVVPVQTTFGAPVTASYVPGGFAVPGHITRARGR